MLSRRPWTIGSAVEHHIDIVGVTGSIPVSSTQFHVKNANNMHIDYDFSMDLEIATKQYEDATKAFLEIAMGLGDDELDLRKNEGWSPRQIIHHVADSEAQSYGRLRQLIVEEGTLIQGYDEAKWAECTTLAYKELPIQEPLDVFRAVRAASLTVLRRLRPDQYDNKGIHSETGEYSMQRWIDNYVAHPTNHAAQILEVIGK
jgi:hypothetical protein